MAEETAEVRVVVKSAGAMFTASLLDWLGSRKTKTLLLTILVAVVAPHLGVPASVVQGLMALGGLGVAAQGVADIKTGGSRR